MLNAGVKIAKAKRVDCKEDEKELLQISKENAIMLNVKKKGIETLYLAVKIEDIVSNEDAYADIYEAEDRYDFSAYGSEPLVTLEDIASEEKRAKSMEEGLSNPMTRRSALEAQLSAILAKDRYHETKVYDLGYKLNEARIQRRVHDYIKDIANKKK